MSESLQETIRNEVLKKAASEITGRVIDRTFEVTSGMFGRRKLVVRLSFGILFRFYNSPKYDRVVIAFERMLAKFRIPASKEVLQIGERKYVHSLSVRERTDGVLPFIAASESLEYEEFLTDSITASSAIIYLSPITDSDRLTFEHLQSIMTDTLWFFNEFERTMRDQLEIKAAVKFCKVTLNAFQALEIVEALRGTIPNIDSSIEEDDERSIVVQLTDSSIIGSLLAAMEK